MQPHGLADTGALLALLDRRDPWHEACENAFSTLRFPFATTAAVLAELFHLIADHPTALAHAWKLVRSDALTVLPIAGSDMTAIERSMLKYSDRPMDFADATLLRLAERESLTTIFTIDHDDFETYRINGRTRFRILPPR